MNDTIEFPPIEAPAANLAPASIKSAVLAQFADAERTVTALADKYRRVAFDCTTARGMADAKAARMDLRENGRYAVQRAESRVKADVNDLKRVMADEVERIVGIVRPVEDAIDQQIKAREEQVAAEKAERDRKAAEEARIEAERQQRHEDGIATLAGYVGKAKGWSAERMANGIAFVEKIQIDPAHWQEYTERAAKTLAETLEALRTMHAAQVKAEAEAAELAALRAEKAAREAEDALVSSLHGNSRRIEAMTVAYIQKASRAFETAAVDWQDDPRPRVREAVAEGRRFLAERLSDAIEEAARRDGVAEANRRAAEILAPPPEQPHTSSLRVTPPPTDTMTLPEGGGTILIVAPDADKEWGDALRGNGEPAPADVPLIRGEVGEIADRVNIVTTDEPATLPPTITIGDISARLGFIVTAEFIIGLGFVRQIRIGRGVHFLATDWPRLCDALCRHIVTKRAEF